MSAPILGDLVTLQHANGEPQGQITELTSDAAGVYVTVFIYREEFEK